jgi:hypothetical protein
MDPVENENKENGHRSKIGFWVDRPAMGLVDEKRLVARRSDLDWRSLTCCQSMLR